MTLDALVLGRPKQALMRDIDHLIVGGPDSSRLRSRTVTQCWPDGDGSGAFVIPTMG
jgi:hypothetical protein